MDIPEENMDIPEEKNQGVIFDLRGRCRPGVRSVCRIGKTMEEVPYDDGRTH